jgi:hypothetical protein
LKNRRKQVLEEIDLKSNKLYILFGGIAAAMGMPPYYSHPCWDGERP